MIITNGEKTLIWKVLAFVLGLLFTAVSALYGFQARRIDDHEMRLRMLEACTIEMAGDIKRIVYILEKESTK